MKPFYRRLGAGAGFAGMALIVTLSCCTFAKRDMGFEQRIQSFAENQRPGSEMNLFNSENLSGWSVHGLGAWSVEDGVLRVSRGLGYLATRCEAFHDFRFSLDIRISSGGNSGVFFRARHPGWFDRPWPYGYEVQIDHHNPKNPTGSLYNLQPADPVLSTDREWFTMEILSQASLQQVRINGTLVASVTDETFARGFIALQAHDPWSVVEFKNIRIRIPEAERETEK